jgi:hypothetical protein
MLGYLHPFVLLPLHGYYVQLIYLVVDCGMKFISPLSENLLNSFLGDAEREHLDFFLRIYEWGDENIMECMGKLKILLIHVHDVVQYMDY